jgi:hypothetical protein
MKVLLSVLALVCVLCLAMVPLMSSQGKSGNSDVAAAIERMENEGLKADMAKDTSWAKKNLSDDFIAGTSFGEWETKASQLKDAEDSNNKTNSAQISDMKVTVHGNVAIARFVDTYDDVYKGEHRSRKVICTDTWVKDGGAWKEIADHCSQAK